MSSTSSATCPLCRKTLPSAAPHGLCPGCLLKAGVPTATPGPAAARPKFIPPTPAELARDFPQLEIIELIGQGGMSAVYRARQPSLDRVVALKILPPETARDPGFAERFTREARALARLSHAAIVAVHDFGQAGAFPYLVMEFVDGVNLRHLLTAGKMSPAEALAIVPPICDALQYAHDRGIVHRDIKPENILLGKNGVVKIADFGLAKLASSEAANFSLTGERDVMGTPYYMAPEQVERPLEVDHRADIYSLGVVFYQMLTGELPLGRFAAPSRKVTIDVRLDEVVLRALEHAPEQRYQQATALKAEVETIAATAGPSQETRLPPTNAEKPNSVPTQGIDYRTKRTAFGRPLLHIATGTDRVTGKGRVARGIIAIGRSAVGVIAIGGFARGIIAVGGVAVGVLAIGGTALGVVSVAGLAMAALFAAGGVAFGGIAMGSVAIGYFALGPLALLGHALGNNQADDEAIVFFSGYARPLLLGSLLTILTVLSCFQLGGLAALAQTLRRRYWGSLILWIVLIAVSIPGSLFLVFALDAANWLGRRPIMGTLSNFSLLTRSSQLDSFVIARGWIAEAPAGTPIDATNFAAALIGDLPDVTVREFLPATSVASGATVTMNPGFGSPRRFLLFATIRSSIKNMPNVQLQIIPSFRNQSYQLHLNATFPPTYDRGIGEPQLIAPLNFSSGTLIENEPVAIPISAASAQRRFYAVFTLQSWKSYLQQSGRAGPVIRNADSRGGPKISSNDSIVPAQQIPAVSPPTIGSSLFPPTEFDLMESNPEILREQLRLAEPELALEKARFDAGLSTSSPVLEAERRVTRLRAKLAGDRVAFARGDVEAVVKIYEDLRQRRNSGIATNLEVQAAESELNIAQIRLVQEAKRSSAASTGETANPR